MNIKHVFLVSLVFTLVCCSLTSVAAEKRFLIAYNTDNGVEQRRFYIWQENITIDELAEQCYSRLVSKIAEGDVKKITFTETRFQNDKLWDALLKQIKKEGDFTAEVNQNTITVTKANK